MQEKQAVLPLFIGVTNDELSLAQQIIISVSGQILEADNSIFDFSTLKDTKISQTIDFLNVVLAEIFKIELGDDDLCFPRVNFEFQGKKGLFDFRFCKMCYQNEIVILWTITPTIENLLDNEKQQKHHEQAMTEEQKHLR
jgi:hypothetical protein